MWDLPHPGEAQDHHLQEPVQESVSLARWRRLLLATTEFENLGKSLLVRFRGTLR